jgi:hypothetical protein
MIEAQKILQRLIRAATVTSKLFTNQKAGMHIFTTRRKTHGNTERASDD